MPMPWSSPTYIDGYMDNSGDWPVLGMHACIGYSCIMHAVEEMVLVMHVYGPAIRLARWLLG
jgi:hypothetical protein